MVFLGILDLWSLPKEVYEESELVQLLIFVFKSSCPNLLIIFRINLFKLLNKFLFKYNLYWGILHPELSVYLYKLSSKDFV